MIISCINCLKKFEVNSELIPTEGRTIQCGSCNHTWFFNKKNQEENLNIATTVEDRPRQSTDDRPVNIKNTLKPNKIKQKSKYDQKKIDKDDYKASFNFGNFLSILIVLIISFIASLIVIDTFKTPLFVFFPDLEFLMFNFFETLKDIQLFINDLI